MGYKFTQPLKGVIIIENDRGEYMSRSVEALRTMERSTGLPEPTRAMARDALQAFGLLEEKVEDDVISSDTIATIAGVKVYQDLISRVFFIVLKGTRLFGSLSDIERKIKRSIGL